MGLDIGFIGRAILSEPKCCFLSSHAKFATVRKAIFLFLAKDAKNAKGSGAKLKNFSLRSKLTLWNAALFLVAILAFGGLQIWLATRSAEQILDQSLIARAEGSMRGGPPGRGPFGPGFGRPMAGPGGQSQNIAPNGGDPNTQPQNPPPQDRRPQPGDAPLSQGNPNGLAQRQGGPPPDSPGSPFFFRRPAFFNADGRSPEPQQNIAPWAPMLVAQTLKGELQRGYVTVQDTRLRVISMPLRRPDGSFDGVQVVQEAAGIELAQKAQMLSMLSALPIVLLISFGLSLVLSRLVLVPVSKLTRTAETLAQNTGSSERIETTGEDEMGRLSMAFNQMTDQMQSANAQLAESLERQKRFASDAAHELRTPLTSIALAAENGLHDGATDEERLRSLQIIERSSASLRRLTDILLSLARIDAGRASMDLAPLSISSIMPEAIANAGLEGDARIRLEIDENSLTVLANADAMRQILTNLLSNAAAATPEDGFILIAQSGTCLRVQDSGAGIAPEHLSKLFDRFYRVDTSRTRASGGFGLGLAITKALVDAQSANISVSSSVGKGTTFSIDFQENEQNS